MISTATGSMAGPMLVVEHPGAPNAARMVWTAVPDATRRSIDLAEGEDIFTAIHALLDAEGALGGTFTLLSGTLASLTLMTGGRGSDTPMTFHGPFEITAPARVVGGAGIVGVDEDGRRTTHCHAVFCDASLQTVGGHLIAGKAIAGPGGMMLDLTLLNGARFARRHDDETNFIIFHPEPA
ncbi:PPC domain-containing DNA-binding protein [Sphingopyxis sp. CCNWLW253]|uniref:PPC domain-containing DNA-binding protein n=1 Tax=unclassified Sphingopyxis TaxID=2614943 RepID=UPI003012C659